MILATKHGLSRHPLYFIWKTIKSRCGNEKDKDYKWYGGRGIRLCDNFCNDFQSFYDYLMACGWREGCQVDRIDNSKGYEVGNIRLVTSKENNRNKRNNVYYTIDNIFATINEHAERVGLNPSTVRTRRQIGWKTEDLLLPLLRKRCA